MSESMSAGAEAKAWFRQRVEELPDCHVDAVWEIWHREDEDDLPTHFEDGEPVPRWVFALRRVIVERHPTP
jgi:hypothetical protein